MWLKEMLWRGAVLVVAWFIGMLEYFGYDPDHDED